MFVRIKSISQGTGAILFTVIKIKNEKHLLISYCRYSDCLTLSIVIIRVSPLVPVVPVQINKLVASSVDPAISIINTSVLGV